MAEQNNKVVDCQDAPWAPKLPRLKGKLVDALRAVEKDKHRCFWANVIMRIPGVYDCKVDKHVTQIKFDVNPDIAVRYQNSKEMQELLIINERSIKELTRMVKKLGGIVYADLQPPRDSIRLNRLRSPEFKKLREASRIARKNKTKGKYTKPSDKGHRSGIGRSHMWHEDAERA
jgi:hypothetical protein